MLKVKKIAATPFFQIAVLTALVLVGLLFDQGPWEPLERVHFDFLAAHFREPEKQPVAIVAIDDKSIRRIGEWPWPRSRIAEMVRYLSRNGADSLGICLLFRHGEDNPGLAEIDSLRTRIAGHPWRGGKHTVQVLDGMLNTAASRLNQDGRLISAIRRARNVVLPIRFTKEADPAEQENRPSGLLIINSLNISRLPADAGDRSFAMMADSGRRELINATGVRETFAELASKAGALGHVNLLEDPDGVVRGVPLFIHYKERLTPAFALQLALKHIDGRIRDVEMDRDFFGQPRLRVKHLAISTDEDYRILFSHDRAWTRDITYSFADVLEGKADPSLFNKKIILIGLTDQDAARSYRVGSGARASLVEINANILARVLSPVRLSRPSWAETLEILALFYFAFFLAFLIPRVTMRTGIMILAVFMATWYVACVGLFLGYGYWIKVFVPVLPACVGFAFVHAVLYSGRIRQDRLSDNKTLGLSYQSQGMLDMAYEKYMQCPVEDESVRNLLYTLALDFERKRMLNKALSIYQHISVAGAFKDVHKRINRLKPLDSTLALSVGTIEAPLMMDDASAKPTFGRYELLRELGRGSMGTVYLGRDPKINREVAIKTLAYADVDSNDLKAVKARFFREAQAAGRLSHPNIVSVHDVGEEHDMAYIAMELLVGEDLTGFCQPGRLLPPERVLSIIAAVTSALDYAHNKGVIHRDIKPANIMLLKNGRVKVTDFGIAQVVDASRTRTGVVLGTPSYMSPEQVSGKPLDGRSDLFSLGIVFYELLTGAKPFRGDSVSSLLYAITHTPFVPLTEAAVDVPVCCKTIVRKLLAKAASRRYPSAAMTAEALERCRDGLRDRSD